MTTIAETKVCNYQGYEFGARYPDSVCIEGRLWDADYCDSNGNLYDREEDVPCPMCRREDAIRWHAEQVRQWHVQRADEECAAPSR